jgi:hypothetical protein
MSKRVWSCNDCGATCETGDTEIYFATMKMHTNHTGHLDFKNWKVMFTAPKCKDEK